MWSVTFSPDDLRAISGSWYHKVKVWGVASVTGYASRYGCQTGTSVSFFPDGLRAISRNRKVNSVAFSTDGLRAISGGWPHKVMVWSVAG